MPIYRHSRYIRTGKVRLTSFNLRIINSYQFAMAKRIKAADAAIPPAVTAPAAAGETGVASTAAEVTAPVATASSRASKTDPITVKFRDHEGKPTERTFSKEVHGANFADLADEFKATNAKKLIQE